MAEAFVYAAAALVALWGVAHLVPTRVVVAGFGGISDANRRILEMEWIAEGLTMLFVAVLVVGVTLDGGAGNHVAVIVYRMAAGALTAIAVLTAVTGARTSVRWFKACPLLLSVVVALLLAGSVA